MTDSGKTFVRRGKNKEELMIRTKIKFVIDIKNTMKNSAFNAVQPREVLCCKRN
jgi:hypothetical protein